MTAQVEALVQRSDRAAILLSSILAVGAAVTCTLTLVLPGVLHGPAAMNGSARGTALVMLVLGVGCVLVGMTLARTQGSHRARVLWLGGLGYLLYNAVMLCFGTPFNALFLGYVAVLGLSFWGLVSALVSTRPDPAWSARDRPAAGYLLTVVVLNALAWLAQVVPAAGDRSPAFLEGTGLITNPVFVQDLAVWLPVMAVAGVLLWTGHHWSLLVGGAGLVYWQLEAVGVAVDQWWGHHADPGSPAVSLAGAYLFVGVFLVGLLPTYSVLRRLPGPR